MIKQWIRPPGSSTRIGLALAALFATALPAVSQTLEDAVDNPAGITFSVYSYDLINQQELPAIDWFPQIVTTHDGEDAIEASNLPKGSFTRLDATVQGPAHVSFQWKVATDSPLDRIGFLDRFDSFNPQYGDIDWQPATVRIDCGEQMISWYLEVSQYSSGVSNAAWLDEIVVTPIPVVPELQTALDESSTDFHSDDWVEQIDAGSTNGSRAKSGDIPEGSASAFLFEAEGPLEISFDWGVDADISGFNTRLVFGDNRNDNATIYAGDDPGSRDLQFGPGSHCFSFAFVRDFSTNPDYVGANEGFVDNLKILKVNPSPSLAVALDTAPNVYGQEWSRQTQITHDGVDAACVSGLAVGQSERMYVELPDDPGRLSLWVKLSTEEEFGTLWAWVDGDFIGRFTGEQDWTKIETYLDAGQDRVLWLNYFRSSGGTGDAGDNAAYVDQVEFEAGATPPVPPPPSFQPDLTIKAPRNRFKGENRYNTNGAGQLGKFITKPRRTLGKFKLRCQNDCKTAADQMRFYGTRSNRHFDILYVIKSEGELFNISAEFQTGQFTTRTLQYLESAPYEVWIGLTDRGRRRTQTARIRGVSLSDPSKSDTVKARMRIKRR